MCEPETECELRVEIRSPSRDDMHVWSISKLLDMKDSYSVSAECTQRDEKWTDEFGSLSS